MAHNQARKRGKQVYASVDEEAGTIVLQAYAASKEQLKEWAEQDAKATAEAKKTRGK